MTRRESRRRLRADALPEDLTLAIGLVWGFVSTCQFEEAEQLARGCLRLWPGEKRLILLAAHAAVELGIPLDETSLTVLNTVECQEASRMILRRAHQDADA